MRSSFAGCFAAVLTLLAGPAFADVTVYADSLAAGWTDYSWATPNFASTTPVHSGTKAVSVSSIGFQGFYLHSGTSFNVAGTDQITFWVYGSATQRTLTLQLNNNAAYQKALTIPPGAWTQFNVPFSALSFSGALSEFWLQDDGQGAMTYSVDDIVLLIAPVAPPPPPTLAVNASTGRKPISPNIYGMNYADEGLAAELRLPVRRWGGNATSRYNYLNDVSNHGSDYFFENIIEGNSPTLPANSAANQFIDQDRRTGTRTLMTVPVLGYVANRRPPGDTHPYDCGFPKTQFPTQDDADPFDLNCGNGLNGGVAVTAGSTAGNTSTVSDPAFVAGWVNYLKGRYGAASAGGVAFYNLDNEPALWNSTHRDAHPQPLTYDELVTKSQAIGAAVKSADASAKTIGPAEYGWCAYFYSAADGAGNTKGCVPGNDSAAHANLQIMDYYLQQMKAYELQNGIRVLDYFDLHYYPQSNGVSLSPAGSAATQALRLRSTRSLWDPAYTDESWIGQGNVNGGIIRMLPRMRDWVANNYPGTKLAISEYNWGGLEDINGAVTQADVLGLFGREGLDLATLWDPPTSAQPGAFAFRMYRNYDGAGSGFGDTSVQAASTDQGQLAVYAAQRASDQAITVMVVNKTGAPIATTLSLAGFIPAATAKVYRYSTNALGSIERLPDQAVTASGFSSSFAANSITLYVLTPNRSGDAPQILWLKSTGRTALWLMSGATQIGGRELFGDGTNWAPKLVGDFNGDGHSDILYERSDGSSAMWTMNGSTQIGGALLIGPGTGWSAKFVGDFDGDGKSDILWEHTDGRTAIWLMNGTAQKGGAVILPGGTGWHVKSIGDFNGDGKADLLWENVDGSSALWIMNGTTQVGGGRLFAGGSGWFATRVADLDGDGKADILWTHTDGRVAVWLMNGSTQVGGAVIQAAGTGFAIAAVGDINGDRRADIVMAKPDGTTKWLAMNGTAIIGGGNIFASGAPVHAVRRVLDYSGDGFGDLLVVDPVSGDTSMAIFNGVGFDVSPVLAGVYGYVPLIP